MKKRSFLTACLLVVFGACGPSTGNDPIYAALVADPPTEVPQRHLDRLKSGLPSCDVFNEGLTNQYMTCWWPGGRPVGGAGLYYYAPNPLSPPDQSKLVTPSDAKVTTIIF